MERRRLMSTLLSVVAILISLLATHVRSDASDHRYKEGDPVPLYANKVGPFHNPRYVATHHPFSDLLSISSFPSN